MILLAILLLSALFAFCALPMAAGALVRWLWSRLN